MIDPAVFFNFAATGPILRLIAIIEATNSAMDPMWARLTVAALPSIFALGIAWIAFRWNRNNEHRRWVLDHRTTEWKKLLELASDVERFMPSVEIGRVITDAVYDAEFSQHLHTFTRETLNCVFIAPKSAEEIYERLVKVQVLNDQVKGEIELYKSNPLAAAERGAPTPLGSAKKVQFELASLWRDIRAFAAKDLEAQRGARRIKRNKERRTHEL